ncbi:MAG: biotin/lipoyl-binding protein, partial [Rhizobiales bacterium]|nr:biotin/lipoyl-binding protein [Hyphomicrobiales bacterium]
MAVGLVAGAALWIVSGWLTADAPVQKQGARQAAKLFSVTVFPVTVEPHSRVLTVSGRSEADRRTVLTVRANGTVTQINVRRGSRIKEGEVVAVLSDEAREANVNQARARVEQRRKEYEARLPLVAQGVMPRLNL